MAFMAAALPYIAAVGTAVSAVGAVAQGQAAKNASEYNARLAERDALLARKKSEEEERRYRLQSQKQKGAMRAAYARAGVTMEGSPMDVLAESAYTAELDALTIRAGGRAQSASLESQARIARLQGRSQLAGSYASAASELLGGATDYYRMTRT
jgi:hypothetical protein